MKYLSCLVCLLVLSCARQIISVPEKSMRLNTKSLVVQDRASEHNFFKALKNQIKVLELKDSASILRFGPKTIATGEYLNELKKLSELENNNWLDYIKENFNFYEVYGREDYSQVLVTGYYEPIVKGSKFKTEIFNTPLYRTPIEFKNGKFFERKVIDQDKILEGKNLEIAWVDSIDAFFIQIQGSGLVDVGNHERIRVGYDKQNGHPYVAIGKFLTDYIPKEKMSMQAIKEYLKTLSASDRQEILNKNPSYVFFRELKSEAMTSIGTEVTPGRTIAIDRSLFPKGALCYLDIFEPQFENIEDTEANYFLNSPRFVFDQDTGGAIKGTGRVDLYFGTGDYYAQKAGGFKSFGQLYYLFPKKYE